MMWLLMLPLLAVVSLLMIAFAKSYRWVCFHVAWASAISIAVYAVGLTYEYPKDRAIFVQFAQLWGLFLVPVAIGKSVSILLRKHGDRGAMSLLPILVGFGFPVLFIASFRVNSVFW